MKNIVLFSALTILIIGGVMELLIPFFLFILIPFIIPLLLWNWKWLLAYTILFVLVFSYFYYDFRFVYNNSFGGQFRGESLKLMLVGGVSGIIPKAISLLLIKYNNAKPIQRVVAFFGIIPVSIYLFLIML